MLNRVRFADHPAKRGSIICTASTDRNKDFKYGEHFMIMNPEHTDYELYAPSIYGERLKAEE